MSKFLITQQDGKQFLIDTDSSHSQLLIEYGPSTDIHPVQEIVDDTPVVATPVAKKAKAK